MGQLPTLEVDGKVLNQSLAIARYLAKVVKLTGENALEDYEIDSAVDSINDFRQSELNEDGRSYKKLFGLSKQRWMWYERWDKKKSQKIDITFKYF
jgi:glutathione S-transferase